MNLSNLKPPAGQKKKGRRVGQGMGSGRGKYSGRGAKGAKSVSGYSRMRGFEGGQMPLHRRLPKRGFSNALFRTEYVVINVARLEELQATTITPDSLLKTGVISKLYDGLKVLGNGEITRKINITAHAISEAAKQKIEAAGGTVTLIEKKAKFMREPKKRPAK